MTSGIGPPILVSARDREALVQGLIRERGLSLEEAEEWATEHVKVYPPIKPPLDSTPHRRAR